MPAINKTNLELLREQFNALKDVFSGRSPFQGDEMRKFMTHSGLDLNDDASYDLLESGLTKDAFDDIAYLSLTHGLVNRFYGIMDTTWIQHTSLVTRSRQTCLDQLITQLDHFRPLLDSRTLPAQADPFHVRAFNMLMNDYRTGALKTYHDQLAVPAAVETYGELTARFNELSKNINDPARHAKPYEIRRYLDHTQSAVSMLRKDTDSFAPDQMTAFLTQSKVSLAHITKTFQDVALMSAAHTVNHGQIEDIDLRYHHALRGLDEAGIDIHDPATYTAIGTDKKTFWDNYAKQVDWNNNGAGKAYGIPVTPYQPKP